MFFYAYLKFLSRFCQNRIFYIGCHDISKTTKRIKFKFLYCSIYSASAVLAGTRIIVKSIAVFFLNKTVVFLCVLFRVFAFE